MATYCTAADLLNYADERLLRELATDNGQPFQGDLSTSGVITELIAMASGRLEAACFVSEHYSADELTSMSDNSKALARSIVARLVVADLMSRRFDRFTVEHIRTMREDGENYLQLLRNGSRLFDVGNHAAAGLPEQSFPSVQQIVDLNQITQRTKNFYPRTEKRLPLSLGGG